MATHYIHSLTLSGTINIIVTKYFCLLIKAVFSKIEHCIIHPTKLQK